LKDGKLTRIENEDPVPDVFHTNARKACPAGKNKKTIKVSGW
jgi:hypothetical protein